MAKPSSRSTRALRPALLAVALSAGVVVVPHIAGASPDAPRTQPTVASVQKELGRLALKNSQLVEKYDQARVQATRRSAQAARAQRAATKARAAYRLASRQMTQTLLSSYESSDINSAAALLVSDNGASYLDRLAAMSMLSSHEAQVVQHMTSVKADADSTSRQAVTLLAEARKQLAGVRKSRAAVLRQIAKYKAALNMLTAAQRSAFSGAINPAVQSASVQFLLGHLQGTPRERTAVRFALDQVGKPYVFGAAGPDSYDCSGLTMAAWRAAGISLPHSAADQYNYGRHVSVNQLSPGDLIFMYSPIGHVTIYIGNGLMVSAPQEGEDVSVVSVSSFSNDIVGATHLA